MVTLNWYQLLEAFLCVRTGNVYDSEPAPVNVSVDVQQPDRAFVMVSFSPVNELCSAKVFSISPSPGSGRVPRPRGPPSALTFRPSSPQTRPLIIQSEPGGGKLQLWCSETLPISQMTGVEGEQMVVPWRAGRVRSPTD